MPASAKMLSVGERRRQLVTVRSASLMGFLSLRQVRLLRHYTGSVTAFVFSYEVNNCQDCCASGFCSNSERNSACRLKSPRREDGF